MIWAFFLAALSVQPALETPAGLEVKVGGFVGQRLRANLENWELRAPSANPAMLQMFYDRDRLPDRSLLPWSGEFVGKYLCSSILSYRLLRDPRQKANIDRIVNALMASQGEDGYLGVFSRYDRLTGKNWDLWNHYWAIRALLLYNEEFRSPAAVRAAARGADLIADTFLDRGLHMTNDGSFGQMNYAVIHAYTMLHRLTGNPRYLKMANWIVAEWDHEGAGQYMKGALAGKEMFEFPGNRWESLHDFLGMYDMYLITGEARYRDAFMHIWRSILRGDRHNTGGFTSGERTTGNPYDTGAIETCCTVAWIDMSIAMLKLTADSRVADEIELSTLNGNLGGQSLSGSWWTYNTPMDGVKEASAHTINFQCRPGSPELNCCSVNGPRGVAMVWDWALLRSPGGYALSYYGESTLKADDLIIEQRTDYPVGGNIALRLTLAKPRSFDLRLRIPSWSAKTRVAVNGREIAALPGTYLSLPREWKTGDRIDLRLGMSLHYWAGEKQVGGLASIYRGPVLLAFDPAFNRMDAPAMPELDAREITYELESPERPYKPLLLVKTGDVRLCDFASAGAVGNAYRTWLPVRNLQPVAFHLEHPVWDNRAVSSTAVASDPVDEIIASNRRSITRLLPAAEASAKAILAGGRYFIAGSHAGWRSEGTGRAGGVYRIAELRTAAEARPGDVVWVGYLPSGYEADLAVAHELEQKGAVVVVMGPRPPSGPPAVKHWIDTFARWDARPNFVLMANILTLWQITGELASATAREDKTLIFWQSFGMPKGPERAERYKDRVFHSPGEPRMRPAPAGALARAYVDFIERMVAALRERETANIEAVAAEMKRRASAGRPAVMMTNSHVMVYSMEGDGKWFRYLRDPKELEPALAGGGYLVYLGYYHRIDEAMWNAVRGSGAKAVWMVVPRPDQKLDFAGVGDMLIDQRWQMGDAAVTVPDYDVKLLPASGFAQLFLYNWLERSVGVSTK